MTRVELLLACAVIVGGLVFTADLYTHYLDRAKIGAARELVVGLARAAAAYRETTGADPPGRVDGGCARALSAIRAEPTAAVALNTIPGPWILTAEGPPRCVDPWGIPIRYLTSQSEHPEHRRRLLLGGGRPLFECAGPDRAFGDADPSARIDNIRSDDPG